QVKVGGRELHCQHCDHNHFHLKQASLDRPILGGLTRLEGWAGHQASIYVCGRCGLAHFFMSAPGVEHHSEEEASHGQSGEAREPVPEDTCLACGAKVPPEAARCPACGWTWGNEQTET